MPKLEAMSSSQASVPLASSPDMGGEASGWVEPRTHCPHLSELPPSLPQLPAFDSLCKGCNDPQENWACLVCQEVLCGRYINGHMLAHSQATDHSMAISFRDLSVWCFKCESYLDAQVISQLRPVFEMLYTMKFGEAPPSRDPLLLVSVEGFHKTAS